jgi:hypothetical protein
VAVRVGNLHQRLVEHLDVVGRHVRPSAARPQDRRQRLAWFAQDAENRGTSRPSARFPRVAGSFPMAPARTARATLRVIKRTRGWTRPKLREPHAADRWTWLVIAIHTQLRLARSLTDSKWASSRTGVRPRSSRSAVRTFPA